MYSDHSFDKFSDIDTTVDFRRDTAKGKDPDTYSRTLRRYHKLLWSKRLPCETYFELEEGVPGHYLHHLSNLGEFSMSSDTVIPTFEWHQKIQALISYDEMNVFNAARYTIGGMMIFPGNRIKGKWTINQARGCIRSIADRFDLTLECIRRHYSNERSPLSNVLIRYASFFDLFDNFRGYVEFFLLNDLVSADFSSVKISFPFDDFNGSAIPIDVEEYKAYRLASCAFIEARNKRIKKFIAGD